ncbi:MAG: NAD(P)-dependent alcohol dehydrogenase [Myxococcota bacterium]|jgi:NADPH:quinone reductase-like Zn-dependent oxidoreductase|nr:NAD(P)-dependent alcohol dehydrogenase [Myxococcota bacterium]
MKAIVQNSYGSPDVLELKEIAPPVLRDDDVLLRVVAASLNAGDLFSMRGSPWLARFAVGFPRPRDYVLGWDAAGVVEAVGKSVTRFKPGESVYCACQGTLAEVARARESTVAMKPASLDFEKAAAVPTACLTALKGLRDVGKVRPGQKVLINGASGGVGTFAVQIGRTLGAEVTGVCSARNVEMVRALGADHVVDYTEEDFTSGGQQYDLILDNAGNRSFSDLRRALTPRGMILPNSGYGGMGYVLRALALAPFLRQQASMFAAQPSGADLDALTELIDAGKVGPVVDRTYPLHEARQAFRYLEEEHARGKVVLSVAQGRGVGP